MTRSDDSAPRRRAAGPPAAAAVATPAGAPRADSPTSPAPAPASFGRRATPTVYEPPGADVRASIVVPGTTLAGRYRVVRFIAEGGMGAVYEAEDLELDTRVALKLIRPEVASKPLALERLKREVLLARRVSHPNVCRLFDFGRHVEPTADDGEPRVIEFLTMELLAGESLVDLLNRRGRLTPAEALPLVRQMVAALAAAHRAGVVHRDFKSANVLLVPAPGADRDDLARLRAVVTDFGLARGAGGGATDTTATGTVVGTPAYVAPEQLTGEEPTPAMDQYALGVVLFEMVTCRHPIPTGDAASMLLHRLREPAPPPSRFVPELDPRWDRAIARALEREPARRFFGVEELLAALETEAPRADASAARRRRAGWLVAAVGLAAIGGLWLLRQETPPSSATTPPHLAAPHQLTAAGELDLFPSFLADGRGIAYASGRSGAFGLHLRAADGSDSPFLAGVAALQPAVSPNGQWIAYHGSADGGIWVAPLDGSTPPRQLVATGSWPAWSPDGSRLAYQSEPLVDLAPNAVAAMPPSTIWIVPLDGTPARPLTAAGSPSGGHGAPSWSVDGAWVFFVTADRRAAAVWAAAVDGSELVRLVDRHTYTYDPVASPDGRWLVYAGAGAGLPSGLWAVPLAAGRPQAVEPMLLLAVDGRIPRHPTFSRDGRRLAYALLELSSGLLAIDPWQRVEAGAEPTVVTEIRERNSRPAFSPDGRWLAFERFGAGVNSDVWVMPATGGEARPVTDQPSIDTVISWLPDSRTLVFRSDRLGRPALWRTDAETHDARIWYDPHMEFDWARLSPDGRRVSLHSRHGSSAPNVWVAEPPAAPVQVTFDSQQMGFACWSPDGRRLGIEIKRGEDAHIGVLELATGAVRQLTDAPGQAWPYSFSPDGRRIAFAGQRNGVWNVYWVDRISGEERRLTRFEGLGGYVRYPAWSPDGTRIVFERAQTVGNVWQAEIVE